MVLIFPGEGDVMQVLYFDGLHAQPHSASLQDHGDVLELSGEAWTQRYSKAQTRLDELFLAAPGFLRFPDGSHAEVQAASDKQALRQMMAYQPGLVERWQSKWMLALLAIVLMAAMLFSVYRWLIPAIADRAVNWVPVVTERELGARVMAVLDDHTFKPSLLTDAQILQAEQILKRTKPANALFPIHLEVRYSSQFGPNAFALPGGTVVVTDQMIQLLQTEKNALLNPEAEERLAAVLAHEVGHIQYRHPMRGLISDSMVTIMMATLFGDFSVVATVAPGILLKMDYSRDAETEADAYAFARLQVLGISPDRFAELFEMLSKKSDSAMNSLPIWMRKSLDYVSSHPNPKLRIERARAAAAK
ncbi:MAG: M48 family metallopeptidase [Undibacterium curvum]|uniref:M48 family metallopeptidase n=1 Tax=Undibacterium curvum TaxID=2762294 RepID=UPI003BC6B55F